AMSASAARWSHSPPDASRSPSRATTSASSTSSPALCPSTSPGPVRAFWPDRATSCSCPPSPSTACKRSATSPSPSFPRWPTSRRAVPATHEEPLYPGYEALLPWHHRQPFDGAEQFPCVIGREQASYFSWSPEPGNAMATWVYVGTRRLNQGTFYVEPGHWFDAGNHPNPEPYYVLRGSLMLSNPDTSDVIELRRGDAANIPALAYHHAWNLGDETCEILWWVPGEMHTDEFKHAISTKEHGEWRG